MILLDSPLKSLQFRLVGSVPASKLTFVAGWADVLTTDMSMFAISESDGQDAGNTSVTIVPAPIASHSRQLKYLSILNPSSNPDVTVSIEVLNNTIIRPTWVGTIPSGSSLLYQDGRGFYGLQSLTTQQVANPFELSALTVIQAQQREVSELLYNILAELRIANSNDGISPEAALASLQ